MSEVPGSLVSVVMAAYNGARFLRAQLDSVLAQTHRDVELVVVDDASDDDTPGLLDEYATRDPRVRVYRNDRNTGHHRAFLAAFSLCQGNYVAPCDQDDVWRADKLATLLAALGTADLAYGDSEFTDAAGQPLGRRLSDTRTMYEGRNPLALVLTNSVSGHALLCRRDLIARAEPFPDGVFYDWWLAVVAAANRGIRYVDQPLVAFRRHPRTVTSLAPSRGTGAPPPGYLHERLQLLRAMARLPGAHQTDADNLATALAEGLDTGRWLPFGRLAWHHRRTLTRIVRGQRLRLALAGARWLVLNRGA